MAWESGRADILVILLALIVLFFIITIIKLGGASAPAGM
jgi:hypothetical protein